MHSFMMNIRTLKAVILGLFVAISPMLNAQDTSDDSSSESKFAKYGVRFVVCTAGKGQLPSPLYTKMGKGYYPITISKMMPSPRLAPEGGVINFYDKEPTKGGKGKDKVEPIITVSIPEAYRGSMAKSICILQPRKENDKEPLAYFIKESEFKRGGVHIINFTNYKLEMITDPTGQFNGKEKRDKISPRVKTQSISSSDSNTWSYYGKSKDGERVNFLLQVAPTASQPEGKRIRAGVMLTMGNTSQVSIVVNHPTLKGACSLLSVQFIDDEIKQTSEAKTAHGKH